MHRLPGVIDVWFDSGSMPFAQWHYPFENEDIFQASFPADFISEGIDQSRGWFYSLLAISTQVTGEAPFRNVVVNEMILDEQGRKMSKRLGNTVDSWDILEKEGADALRWYLISNSPPWVTTRFSRAGVTEAARKFFGTLRNVAAFFATYANVDRWGPEAETPPVNDRPVLDRWILARLDAVSSSMADDLRNYQITRAARTLSEFAQRDLSNWYVRRNRRRFWKGEKGEDKNAAYATLHEVLASVARLMAPIAPFLAETLHRSLVLPVDPDAPLSVHLCSYPAPGSERRDDALEAEMARAMAVTELSRAARTKAGLKVRLPLPRLLVLTGGERLFRSEIADVVRDEINVKKVDFVGREEVMELRLGPNFKGLGPRFGQEVNRVASAIKGLDAASVGRGAARGEWTVQPDGLDAVVVGRDEVEVEEVPAPGFVIVEEAGLRVALDTRVDAALEREGRVREIVHRLQNLRKERRLDVTDRVALVLGAEASLRQDLEEYRSFIAQEMLADLLEVAPLDPEQECWEVDGERLSVRLEKKQHE
jgi:isoleucyl-tRNA synthetase